jgi:hypothetical protein
MQQRVLLRSALSLFAALSAASLTHAQDPTNSDTSSAAQRTLAGRSTVYQEVDTASLESVTTSEHLKAVARGGFAPTEIWRSLEHGEKVECLDCIPIVSKLLFNNNAKTREISAWWLRRRIFGVFGPGEVYSQMVATLADSSQSETRRSYAAQALGEFLAAAGNEPVATAAVSDSSALVRASAVGALERLNTAGPNGELGVALGDSDEKVRLAAVHASTRINAFSDIASLAALVGDTSATVRSHAIAALGALKAQDAVAALVAKLSPDSESVASVRAAAAAALGEIGDGQARAALQTANDSDPDHFVRDAAAVALRRL